MIELRCVIITADGTKILAGTESGKIYMIEREKEAVTHVFEKAHKGKDLFKSSFSDLWAYIECILGMTLTKDQTLLYTGSADKTIGVFDLRNKTKVDSLDFIHTSKLLDGLKKINHDCGLFQTLSILCN